MDDNRDGAVLCYPQACDVTPSGAPFNNSAPLGGVPRWSPPLFKRLSSRQTAAHHLIPWVFKKPILWMGGRDVLEETRSEVSCECKLHTHTHTHTHTHMRVGQRGGGLFVKLAGFFRCGLKFGKMLFRRQGYVIPFRNLQEKGFSDMHGLGGGGVGADLCLRVLPPHGGGGWVGGSVACGWVG